MRRCVSIAVVSAIALSFLAWQAVAAPSSPGDAVEAPSPDDDAPILEVLQAGDVARAAALADAAFLRDENVLHLTESARADHLERLALKFYETGMLEGGTQAERLYARALALRESQSERDPSTLATTLHDFSSILFNRGAYERAEELERRALAIRERILPPADLATARSRRDLGIIAMAQGRLAEAEASLVPAVEAMQASARARPEGAKAPTDDWLHMAVALNSLAELRRQQGDFESAAAILEPLVRDAETKLGESSSQFPYFLNDLAGVYRDEGRFDDAETLLRRSLALRRASPPDASAVPRAMLNLADLYRDQGKREQAESFYKEALAGARAALGRANPELFEFLNQLAVLERDTRAFGKAEPLLREALGLAVKGFGEDHPRVALSHLDLAELLRARGRCDAARAHFDRALAIREKAFGPSHPDVAQVLAASAVCRPGDEAGRRAARAELDRAIAILGGTEAHPEVEVEALEARARFLRSSVAGRAGQKAGHDPVPRDRAALDESERDLDRAIGVVERMRPHRGGGESVRASFFGRYKRLYDLAVRWQVEEGRADAALATAEKARARVLLDQLAAAGVGASSRDPELAKRVNGARAQLAETRQRIAYEQSRTDRPAKERTRRIAELEKRLAQDTRAFQELHDEARNTSPAWRGAIGTEVASTDEIRSVVPRGGWLLRYQVGEERSYLFAVPPDGTIQVFSLKASADDARALSIPAGPLTEASLARALLGARGGGRGNGGEGAEGLLVRLASPQGGRSRGIGGLSTGADPGDRGLHALWRCLVPTALWPRLRPSPQVLVVPDGPLFLLPFEALVISAGADPITTRYWLDDGPVVRYAPSASFLLQVERLSASRERAADGAGRQRVLSVADPDYAAAGRPPRPPVVGDAGSAPEDRVAERAEVVGEPARTPTTAPLVGDSAQPSRAEENTGRGVIRSASGADTRESGHSSTPDEPAVPTPPSARSTDQQIRAATLRGGALSRLPGTAHESDLVRDALRGVAEVVALRGAEAREPAVRAEIEGKHYLHIATHALVDQEGGELFAELALTPPPLGAPARGDDDGFLQLFEIYDLRLDCDLAVLSACSSNTGQVVAGEGIFALSRGFLLGGARRVVASQWSVEDNSTADLVGDLFRRLAASERSGTPPDAALALRDAKRTIRKQPAREHPFYWAPFVITGLE